MAQEGSSVGGDVRRPKKKPPNLFLSPKMQGSSPPLVGGLPPSSAGSSFALPSSAAQNTGTDGGGRSPQQATATPRQMAQREKDRVHFGGADSSTLYVGDYIVDRTGCVSNDNRLLLVAPSEVGSSTGSTPVVAHQPSSWGSHSGLPTHHQRHRPMLTTSPQPQHQQQQGSPSGSPNHRPPSRQSSSAFTAHSTRISQASLQQHQQQQLQQQSASGHSSTANISPALPGGQPQFGHIISTRSPVIQQTPPLRSTNMEAPVSPTVYSKDLVTLPPTSAAASTAGSGVSPTPFRSPQSTSSSVPTSTLLRGVSQTNSNQHHGVVPPTPPPSPIMVQTTSATPLGASLFLPPAVSLADESNNAKGNGSHDKDVSSGGGLGGSHPRSHCFVAAPPPNSNNISLQLGSSFSSPRNPLGSGGASTLRYEDLEMKERLGSGASGVVHRALHVPTGRSLAVKEMDLTPLLIEDEQQQRCGAFEAHTPASGTGGTSLPEPHFAPQQIFDRPQQGRVKQMHTNVLRELHVIHSHYRSPHVIKTYEAFYIKPKLFIVTEFMDLGNLEQLSAQLQGTGDTPGLPERVLALIGEQVLLGLRELHSRGHIHRDIKPSNILLNTHGLVKLSDFGLAEVTEKGLTTDESHCSGTQRYMAPERIRGEVHGAASDIWALGLTLAECAIGKYPFDRRDFKDEFEVLARLNKPIHFPATVDAKLTPFFKKFIARAMDPVAAKRPSAADLLDDPMLSSWRSKFDFPQYIRDCQARKTKLQEAQVVQKRMSTAKNQSYLSQFDDPTLYGAEEEDDQNDDDDDEPATSPTTSVASMSPQRAGQIPQFGKQPKQTKKLHYHSDRDVPFHHPSSSLHFIVEGSPTSGPRKSFRKKPGNRQPPRDRRAAAPWPESFWEIPVEDPMGRKGTSREDELAESASGSEDAKGRQADAAESAADSVAGTLTNKQQQRPSALRRLSTDLQYYGDVEGGGASCGASPLNDESMDHYPLDDAPPRESHDRCRRQPSKSADASTPQAPALRAILDNEIEQSQSQRRRAAFDFSSPLSSNSTEERRCASSAGVRSRSSGHRKRGPRRL